LFSLDLKRRQWTPAPAASRRALARRLYFDLIGLPPTSEEMRAFVNDPAQDATPKLIDRLLADPRYGERWGRHWLDLVRFAESDGFAIDSERPTAWRYRDYVIRSFNRDKPYDVFIKEQLAGDELPGAGDAEEPNTRSERLVALGFLRLGPWEGRCELCNSVTSGFSKRERQYDQLGFPRTDRGVRPLSRPQIRPYSTEGFLPPASVSRSNAHRRSRGAVPQERESG
jgi:hypothetical protein